MREKKIDFDKIKVVLWDMDGTVLNFYEAQKNAIRACFEKFELGECDDDMMHVYDGINHKYWKALERGELTKLQVLEGRFYEFFEKYGLNTEVVTDFNNEYQIRLGDTVCFFPGVQDIIDYFKNKGVFQFAVTNGTKVAQVRKLSKSGLDKVFDAVFISEDVGIEKPNVEFFVPVKKEAERLVPGIDLSEIVIIGDSTTSDMKLGNNVGIKTCWFRHPGQDDCNLRIDMEISDFEELKSAL